MIQATILDYDSLAPTDLDMSALWDLPLKWTCHKATSPEQTSERLKDASIVITNKVKLPAELLQQNPSIKLIVIMATGTNNVDLQAARECGISVCNIVNYSTASVVQHAISVMLALATRVVEYAQGVQSGQWQKSSFFCMLDHPIEELSGKTLGIVGYGAIGKGVATVASALGMKVLIAESLTGSGSEVDRIPLEKLLGEVDVFSVHCPLSDLSQNLIDAKAMAKMRPGTWIINVSRGGIVDEEALRDNLLTGHIGAAALDVLTQEPPADDHPLLQKDIPNFILTPHSAWGSRQSRQQLVAQMEAILKRFLNNEELINQCA